MNWQYMRLILSGLFAINLIVFAVLVGLYLTTSSRVNATRNVLSPVVSTSEVLVAQAAHPPVDTAGAVSISGSVVAGDARVEITKRYLDKYKSPLLPYAEVIVQLADTYGFDYKYILAIGQKESNLCKKIPEESYNCWGYGIHKKGTLRFDNYKLALSSYAEYLKRAYFDKGLTTPELMATKYNPVTPEEWAWGVRFFMNKIEQGDF